MGAVEAGNRLGKADSLRGNPRFPEIAGALGYKAGEPVLWLRRFDLVAALTPSVYQLEDDTAAWHAGLTNSLIPIFRG